MCILFSFFGRAQDGLAWLLMDFCLGIACDWFHGVPQLFWKNAYYHDAIPCGCADVDLLPVPV